MAQKLGRLLGEDVSDTPRVDRFVNEMPATPMPKSAEEAVQAITRLMVLWADFARDLERECAKKVWPQ